MILDVGAAPILAGVFVARPVARRLRRSAVARRFRRTAIWTTVMAYALGIGLLFSGRRR